VGALKVANTSLEKNNYKDSENSSEAITELD